jgi:hypothetical protein
VVWLEANIIVGVRWDYLEAREVMVRLMKFYAHTRHYVIVANKV